MVMGMVSSLIPLLQNMKYFTLLRWQVSLLKGLQQSILYTNCLQTSSYETIHFKHIYRTFKDTAAQTF